MKCALRNKIIYIRNEGYYSSERVQAVFEDLTLSQCADKCTFKVQGVDCTSFEYDAMQLRCLLKEGSGSIMNDSMLPLKTVRNVALFQQLCLPGMVILNLNSQLTFKIGMIRE
uniref:Apple domain-containing protein n=1 Tax=Loa loa TaxID=7209 RepID=A0A1I7V595_LOALO